MTGCETTPLLQMPQGPQAVLLALLAVVTAATAIYGIALARRHGQILPALLVVGGFLACSLEAPVTHLGHVVHAQVGQINLYQALDRFIPWHIGLIYAIFFGLTSAVLYDGFMQGRLTTRLVWLTFCVTMVLNYVFEIAPVKYGIWVYYEPQALWVWHGTQPLFFTFLNAGCAILAATLVIHLTPRRSAWSQVGVLAAIPMGAFMGHLGAGFPFYLAANSAWGAGAVQASGVISIALCLAMVKVCSEHMLETQQRVQLPRQATAAMPAGAVRGIG